MASRGRCGARFPDCPGIGRPTGSSAGSRARAPALRRTDGRPDSRTRCSVLQLRVVANRLVLDACAPRLSGTVSGELLRRARVGRSGCCGLRPDRRRAAACVHARNRRQAESPSHTPPPPCAWMAQSRTWQAIAGVGYLDHRDVLGRGLVAHGVHQVRGLQHQQPRLSIWMRALAMRSSVTVCSADRRPNVVRSEVRLHSRRQRALGEPDGAHAVMNAAGAEARLRDRESFAFADQQVRPPERARCRTPPRHGRAARRRSRRRSGCAAPSRLARRRARGSSIAGGGGSAFCGIRLADHDEQFAARVGRAGDPPLAAVEHVVSRPRATMRQSMLVASLEATAGSVIANAERISPASSGSSQRRLCSRRAEALEQLHVARVGGAAIAGLRRDGRAAHQLAQRRVFEIGQAGAVLGMRQEQVPQTARARAFLLSSSMTGGLFHGKPLAGIRRAAAAYACSAGKISSRMNSSSRSRSAQHFFGVFEVHA